MPASPFAKVVGISCLLAGAFPSAVFSQSGFVTNGTEYAIAGALPGDQVHPQVALNATGGWVVWQDNAIDGSGLGIGASHLDQTLTGALTPLRVNQIGSGDQENAGVALLNDGGAVFVWQGGRQGFQHIFARFRSATNTWLTGDVMVNGSTNYFQATPSVATLDSGNVVVAWSSFNERAAGSMSDVYLQLLTPAGQKFANQGEIAVNNFSPFNQRSPRVAALAGGGFVVVWISEQQRFGFNPAADYANGSSPAQIGSASVDVMARLYSDNGVPLTDEILINTSSNVCASPNVTPSPDGGFAVTWMEKDAVVRNNSWDVYARKFSVSNNLPTGGQVWRINTQLYGDQYLSKIAASGTNFLAVWTSLAQDGSREGVYGTFLNGDGSPSGSEFRVNSTTWGSQMQQAVASDGLGRLLVVWTGFSFGPSGFDLYGQRYANPNAPLFAPAPPVVTSVSSTALRVSWPPVGGLSVSGYEVYADGAASPTAVVTNTSWTMTGVQTNSTHSFQFDYVLADGRRSPLSAAATGTAQDVISTGTVITDPNAGNSGDTLEKLPPAPVNSSTNASALSFAAVAGTYNGLFYDPQNVSDGTAGYFTARTDGFGGYSARISYAGGTYAVSGRFDGQGRSTNTVRNSSLTIELQLDLYGGDQITGSVTDGKFSAALLADRAAFGRSQTTPLAGGYTFVIPGDAGASNSPAGDGVGTLKVDASGNVSWAGTLADGTRVSGKTTLSKNGAWPFYAPLYRGGGLVIGWIQFGGVTNYDAYGEVVWTKAPSSPGLYPNGFTNQTFLAASAYTPPSKALFNKARLVLSGGSLDSPLEQDLNWTGASQFAPQGGTRTKLKFNARMGLISGTIANPATGQSLPFTGVLFEKYNMGAGYFLGGGQSGHVYFGPNP